MNKRNYWRHINIVMLLPLIALLSLYKTNIHFAQFEVFAPFYILIAISPLVLGHLKTMFKGGQIFKKHINSFQNANYGLLTYSLICFNLALFTSLYAGYKTRIGNTPSEPSIEYLVNIQVDKLTQIGAISFGLSLFFLGQMIWNKNENSI